MNSRFWSKVDKNGPNGCWLWLGARYGNGYGAFAIKSKPVPAHRFVYTMIKGEIPKTMRILHKCDNPICVNPEHLFVGSAKDNMLDMVKKGRGKYIARKGEKHPLHKLTRVDVLAIRKRYADNPELYTTISKRYGVHPATISRIIRCLGWK